MVSLMELGLLGAEVEPALEEVSKRFSHAAGWLGATSWDRCKLEEALLAKLCTAHQKRRLPDLRRMGFGDSGFIKL